MKLDGQELREVAATLNAPLVDALPTRIWQGAVETGQAWEWTCLASLCRAAEQDGWRLTLPASALGPDAFAMRNDIPLTVANRAGNSGDPLLTQRFMAAFVPKVTIEKAGHYMSLFREGCPYHRLMAVDPSYSVRPDIVAVAGALTPNTPQLETYDSVLRFGFIDNATSLEGRIRVINAGRPECLEAPRGRLPRLCGIVEASIRKSASRLEDQVAGYRATWGASTPVVAVVGNEPITDVVPLFSVNTDEGAGKCVADLTTFARSTLETLLSDQC